MIVNAQFRLIDAPLMDNETRIRLMVERMARDLVAADAFHEPKGSHESADAGALPGIRRAAAGR